MSLALVADRGRVVTIAAAERAKQEGIIAIAGAMPGQLVVPVARAFPLADALKATELLMGQHPGGKLVLEP